MYIKKVKIPIYFGYLKIIISEDPEFKDVNAKFHTKADEGYSAFTFQDKNGDYSIAFPSDVANSSICHECCHLTNMIYNHIGANLDTKNDETQCYLTGWMFEQVERILNKYKEQKHNSLDDNK